MHQLLSLFALTLIMLTPWSNASATRKYFRGHNFSASVLIDRAPGYGHRYHTENGHQISVREGERYSIVVRNPLPVRVAAAVTVDGLNTIDGKHTSPAKGQKWIIEPYSSITIRGWQTGDSKLRRFYFTNKHDSYAHWKGEKDWKNYDRNLGVIGVAYFWDQQALEWANRPWWRGDADAVTSEALPRALGKQSRSAQSDLARPNPQEKAGTGMGHREWNSVHKVHFHYDTGMYHSSDALKIYYDFASYQPEPQPFEEQGWRYRYQREDFTPEMP